MRAQKLGLREEFALFVVFGQTRSIMSYVDRFVIM